MTPEQLRNDPNYLAGVEQAFLANTRKKLLTEATEHDRRVLLTESIHWAERNADYFFNLAGIVQPPAEMPQFEQAA